MLYILGGLTPSLATLKLTKKNTNLKVITMVRPRGAGFCYNEIEFEVMKEDAKSLLENGADGIAFGCLNKVVLFVLNNKRNDRNHKKLSRRSCFSSCI